MKNPAVIVQDDGRLPWLRCRRACLCLAHNDESVVNCAIETENA
jgi:hypothetical protein